MTNQKVKLNLGSGPSPLDGYDNIDIADGRQVYPLDGIADNSCDEIRASHILEHFGHHQILDILRHWCDKLKPGGILKIAVPDFEQITRKYNSGEQLNVLGYIMGGQIDEYDYHKCIFDTDSLSKLMEAAGLSDITRWRDEGRDCSSLEISLNLAGTKAVCSPGALPDDGEGTIRCRAKIGCVISTPRLTFVDNVSCMVKELAMRGIETTVGQGVYWHQVLSRIIEEKIDEGCDYLLTLDYDTWFTWPMVREMIQLAVTSGADAVIPWQSKRSSDEMLWGNGKTALSRAEYDAGLLPVKSGHFGCTVFKTESFARLKKPWFLPVPGPDGRWGKGRTDADMYFWHNAAESGWRVYTATKVKIGHMQLMCTFPGSFEDNFAPVHCYMDKVNAGHIPEHITNELNQLNEDTEPSKHKNNDKE